MLELFGLLAHARTQPQANTYNVFLMLEMLKRLRSICCKMVFFVGSE